MEERPKRPVPVLSYRAPADEPPPASALDVLKAAMAIGIGLGTLFGVVAATLAFLTSLIEKDGEKILAAMGCVAAFAFGVWASYRCVRDYLSGWNRRRRASDIAHRPGDADQQR